VSTREIKTASIASYVSEQVLILLIGRKRFLLSLFGFLIELTLIEKGAKALVLSPLSAEHVNESFPLIECSLVIIEDLVILVLRDGLC
jgi:hypothetical protein